jgi:hypothetical protein
VIDSLSFDFSDQPGLGWRLRLDQTLEARFSALLTPDDEPLDAAIGEFHERTRRLIRASLRPDMLEHIGMGTS